MSHDLNQRRAAYWDKQAGRYDRAMDFWDRHLFGDSRPWVCGRAAGDVLEVAVGTGRNLPHYPDGVRLTGVDWSPAMLVIGDGAQAERAQHGVERAVWEVQRLGVALAQVGIAAEGGRALAGDGQHGR